jgi:hypothetical protein
MNNTGRVQFSLLQAIVAMFAAAVLLYLNVCHFEPVGALADLFLGDVLTLWLYCMIDNYAPPRPEKSCKVP